MTTPVKTTCAPHIPLDDAADAAMCDLERDLRARGAAGRTGRQYRLSLEILAALIAPAPVLGVTRGQLQDALIILRERHGHAPDSVHTRFRHWRTFFGYCEAEGIVGRSPMAGMKAPALPATLTPVLADEDLTALLRACEGRSYRDVRDLAVVRLMCEAGTPRASELCAIAPDHLNLRADAVMIYDGKGGVDRLIPFGARTGKALSRYVRARAAMPGAAACPALFTSIRAYNGGVQPLTRSGVQDLLEHRSRLAGLPRVWPHQLRHTSYHRLDLAGGSSSDAQKLFGWKSGAMCAHYGASGAARRAAEHARQLAIGDTL